MPRKARVEKRLLRDQDTVGELRAERRDLEETANRKLVEAARVKALRAMAEKEVPADHEPRRTARPGKPLKR